MLTGIGTYTYAWSIGVPGSMPERPMSVFALIDKAVELDVHVVQIADNLPLLDLSINERLRIREYASLNNIKLEIGGRGVTEANLEKYIELASFFLSPVLRMVIDQGDYRPDRDQVVSIIRNLLPEFERKKIVLALENHDRLHASTFKGIVSEIDSMYTGICLDCVNSMGIGEGLETVIDHLAPFTVNLHVKDFTVKRVSHMMGFIIEGTPAGKGLLNLPQLVGKLKSYGRCRSAILELWTPPAETLTETIQREEIWAKESISYLKKTIIQP